MEIVQGNPKDKKVVIAQEIAFAKVLAGNNKTLRDRAIKKLRKWLTVRGNGKWKFTEDEFIRIWTGLFYCMWMSDKFLVQEELAESISKLIHCFKKNSESALLFIKCFYKRILMDWDGLDQYRIDKFQMLSRRFLRQTFIYFKEKNWDETLLNKLMGILYNVVLQQENAIGFVLHFISIYPQELAKIGNGKLDSQIILKLIEPFVKLLARSHDYRTQKETEELFNYLMSQTDTGIEFEEKFNAWREQGFPGQGPHSLTNVEEDMSVEKENDTCSEEDYDPDYESKILDPRAGSVDVFLSQLAIDINGLINLFKKYQNSKQSVPKGRKLLRTLTQKFQAIERGRFPVKIKSNPAFLKKIKKKGQTEKNAKDLLKFTQQLDEEPIKTEEFRNMIVELEDPDEKLDKENLADEEVEGSDEDLDSVQESETKSDAFEFGDEKEQTVQNVKKKSKKNKKALKKVKKDNCINNADKTKKINEQKITIAQDRKSEQNANPKQNFEKKKKKKKSNRAKMEGKSTKQILANMDVVVTPKKKLVNGGVSTDLPRPGPKDVQKVTPVPKRGIKRKILSNWQVQELDTTSPEYYKIETPKVITLEKKTAHETNVLKENEPKSANVKKEDSEENEDAETRKEFVPVFWEKAKAKANRRSGGKSKVFANPFAKIQEDSRTPNRRISFALERNMAQENDQYLEEVKNSPRVPFDGSKKPIQSALKSGLTPSPVNPFYRFKRIKLQNI